MDIHSTGRLFGSEYPVYPIPLTALSGPQKQTARKKLIIFFSIFFAVFHKEDAFLSKNVVVPKLIYCNVLIINAIVGGGQN